MGISSSPFKTAFHLCALKILTYSFYVTTSDHKMDSIFAELGGRTNFLTMWGLVLSIMAFAAKVLVDFFPGFLPICDLKKILSIVALSSESVVSTLYWTLVLSTPELMMSPDSKIEPPTLALDLALHLYPALLLWADHLFFSGSSKNSTGRIICLSHGTQIRSSVLILILTVSYASWIELAHIKNGVSLPYPFLQLAPLGIRLLIYLGAALLSYLFVFISEKLYQL